MKSGTKLEPRLGYINLKERQRIEQQMSSKGLLQKDLGPLVNVDKANISNYLNGKISLPTSVGTALYQVLELEMPSQFPTSPDSSNLIYWSNLYDNEAKRLKYLNLSDLEKLNILNGLEALLQENKPKSE